ncbi:MAG: hypothetical protein IJQ34_03280 [Kiritimatiellae bacterium]|nr:hypothetical protein [Kiritimatiellia bacterium]
MTDFYAWIVPESWMGLMNANDGVAPCYTLPLVSLPSAQNLPGAHVFIIVRGNKGDYLFARVVVNSVERCEDEVGNSLGHLLNIDVATSFRTFRSYADIQALDYKTNALVEFSIGLSSISNSIAAELDKQIKAKTQRLIKHFSEREYLRITPPINQCSALFADKVLLREIASRFCVSELWGSQRVQNPIAHLAIEYLKRHPNFVSNGGIDDVVKRLATVPLITPVSFLTANEPTDAHSNNAIPEVDLSLVPINPNEIKIRRFVARRKAIPIDEMLQKTEAAEKRHQEMLKDISSYLLKNGKKVFQSESIDMAIKCEAGLFVFELKSIACNNAFSQIAKGFFQVLYYSDALMQCGVPIFGKGLIVESNLTEEMADVFSRILGNIGISLYFYNSSHPWPDRITPNIELTSHKDQAIVYPRIRMEDYKEAATMGDSAERSGDGYDAAR